ncbi:MAG: lysoplasmalogenase, partial [Chitinophagaceae bacterium]
MVKNKPGTMLLVIFLVALLVEMMAIAAGYPQVRYVSKIVLMPALAAWYFLQPKQSRNPMNGFIPAALFFSWMGDIFLLFEQRQAVFFMSGLGSFLIAHIVYLVYFSRLRAASGSFYRLGWIVPLGLYYFLLMRLLDPSLGALGWPVRIYGFTICLMLFTAIRLRLDRGGAGRKMLAGALLFVLSDSLLAIDRFYQPVALAGCWIMLTYAVAQ